MPSNSKPIAYLVRHGHDTLSDAKVFVSWTDVPLTDKGRKQAEKVASILKSKDIHLVYSSPLVRCVEMAQMVDGFVYQDRGLLPLNRGILTGIPQSEGEDALDLFMKNPNVRIPMGESRKEAEDRIEGFFTPVLEYAETKTTAIFTHHSVIDILNCLLKGERPDEPKNLVEPGGIVAVYVEGDGYRLEPILNEDDDAGAGMS